MSKSKSMIAAFAAIFGFTALLLAAAPSWAHTDAELQQILAQWRDNDYRDHGDRQ